MELAVDLSPPETKHYPSWRERLFYVARYSQPDQIHVACETARAIGATAVLTVLDPRITRAVREFQRWRNLSLWAMVPNMFAFIRDLTDLGPIGSASARFRRLPPAAMIGTGGRTLRQLRPLMRSDFAAGALWLADVELAAAKGLCIKRVFLHPQLTEIALAGRVTRVFTEFVDRVTEQGMEAGLITHNPLVAADLLGSCLARFSVVISPWNAKGYKMVPGRAACEALFRREPDRFWAVNITAGGSIETARAITDARGLGLAGAVLDLRTLESLAKRPDQLGSTGSPDPHRP
jgi:hypothetical protein